MLYTDGIKKAMLYMFEAHKEQRDKAGLPYVFHPFTVAMQMEDEVTTIVALLHDVVEDTQNTLKDLQKQGFSEDICEAIAVLTHEDGVPYMEYIKKIKTNPIAAKVKIADLKHNSDLSRLPVVTKKDLARVEKYKQALDLLLKESCLE